MSRRAEVWRRTRRHHERGGRCATAQREAWSTGARRRGGLFSRDGPVRQRGCAGRARGRPAPVHGFPRHGMAVLGREARGAPRRCYLPLGDPGTVGGSLAGNRAAVEPADRAAGWLLGLRTLTNQGIATPTPMLSINTMSIRSRGYAVSIGSTCRSFLSAFAPAGAPAKSLAMGPRRARVASRRTARPFRSAGPAGQTPPRSRCAGVPERTTPPARGGGPLSRTRC